jgi:gamma-glutamylcyclotransferase (GGCT)/AIG2-like uncharacterized protein YtfP
VAATYTLHAGETFYFAYGSNLDPQDWERFCWERGFDPSCLNPVQPAVLPDFELVFDYYSRSRRGGALNLRPRVGQMVEGLLFRVTPEGRQALDRKEGHPNYYERFETVALLPDGSAVPVRTYRARADRAGTFHKPTTEYLQICRRGRAHYGLHTRMLEAVAEGHEAELEVLGVFSYGSLMRGESRFGVVEEFGLQCALMARAFGDLYDFGQWPALRLRPVEDDSEHRVAGDFLIPGDLAGLLERLDWIEGFNGFGLEPRLFRRTLIDVYVDHGRPRRAWVYVMDSVPADARPVESGCWRRHRRVRRQFVRSLVAAHAEGVEGFARKVAINMVPPCVSFDPARDDLTMEQLVDAVLSGEVAERRLAQASERWAAVPEPNLNVGSMR